MQTLRRAILVVPLATVWLADCYRPPREYAGPGAFPFDDGTGEDVLRTQRNDSTLAGSLGSFENFSSNAAELRIVATRANSIVQLDAEDVAQGWWAMARLTFTGGLEHPDLRPGAVLDFERRPVTTESAALNVTLLGCTGPRRGNFTFDHSADRVVLQVEEGSRAELYRMHFTAYWTTAGRTQRVDGAFEYAPP